MSARVICDTDHQPKGTGAGTVMHTSSLPAPNDVRTCDKWIAEHQSWYRDCSFRIEVV